MKMKNIFDVLEGIRKRNRERKEEREKSERRLKREREIREVRESESDGSGVGLWGTGN